MNCQIFLIGIFLLFHGVWSIQSNYTCPTECKCQLRNKPTNRINTGLRSICGLEGPIYNVSKLSFTRIKANLATLILKDNLFSTLQPSPLNALNYLKRLDLSKNKITKIQADVFIGLSSLLRLDLSQNKISIIFEDAFKDLISLEKLDLSDNKLFYLTENIFKGLNSLQKLILQGNNINKITFEAFQPLASLKNLGLSSNPLICDCDLNWFPTWVNGRNVAVDKESSCFYPKDLRENPLSSLAPFDFHCNWPLQLPVFEIIPKTKQLVFEGDPFSLSCQISNIERDFQIQWTLNDENIKLDDPEIGLNQSLSEDGSQIISTLLFHELKAKHSGIWQCMAEAQNMSAFLRTDILVVNRDVRSCRATDTDSNKGYYHWPETLPGVTVEQECVAFSSSSFGYPTTFATHTCSMKGLWKNLNISFCPYLSEVTKVLEQFSKTDLGLSKTNVLDSARGLRNYTANNLIHDKMDMVFIARTMNNYIEYVKIHREIADILVDIINSVMKADLTIFQEAQLEDEACSKLIQCLNILPRLLMEVTINRYYRNIVVEEFFIKTEGFPGMTCTSYIFPPNLGGQYRGDKRLRCITYNLTTTTLKEVEASIHLPSSIMKSLIPINKHSYKVQFVYYIHGGLFPSRLDNTKRVTTAVLSAQIVHHPGLTLTEPITIRLRVPTYTPSVVPVWWDPNAANKKGDWSSKGCQVALVQHTLVTFTCNNLSSYGLLQTVSNEGLSPIEPQFHHSPPLVYVGSYICALFLMLALGFYIKNIHGLRMSKKNKHSLMNSWVAMYLLLLVYSIGVVQTDVPRVCQGIGVSLHYLLLCNILWFLITASNQFKKLFKVREEENEDEEFSTDPHPKPMLRFYLVGWGIPLIICGITAAVQLDHYAGPNYCFLSPPASLALYGPASLMLILLIISYLRIHCNLPSSDDSKMAISSNGVMTEEEDDISILDEVFSHSTHLKYQVITFLLFISMWGCGTLVILQPGHSIFKGFEIIYSLLYCVCSSLLGGFVFYAYFYGRKDCPFYQNQSIQHDKMVDSQVEETLPSMLENMASDIPKSYGDSQEGADLTAYEGHELNINGFSSQASSTEHSFSGAEIFYDPRQNVVAKKFFEKNRRQQQFKLIQKNNLCREAARLGEGRRHLKSCGDVKMDNIQGAIPTEINNLAKNFHSLPRKEVSSKLKRMNSLPKLHSNINHHRTEQHDLFHTSTPRFSDSLNNNFYGDISDVNKIPSCVLSESTLSRCSKKKYNSHTSSQRNYVFKESKYQEPTRPKSDIFCASQSGKARKKRRRSSRGVPRSQSALNHNHQELTTIKSCVENDQECV